MTRGHSEPVADGETLPADWEPTLYHAYNPVRSRRLFPVKMYEAQRVDNPDCPRYVDWSRVASLFPEHARLRATADGQSWLDVAASMGGFTPEELYRKLNGVRPQSIREAIDAVRRL